MIKRQELTDPKSCMSRAREDEMTFVLLARDAAAPDAIRFWAAKRCVIGKNKLTDSQIKEAMACADEMDRQLAGSAAIPPAVALLARCPECGSYDRESCARPYHICLNLWHKPPVQDHGPRVDTKGQGFNVAIGGKAALYFGCWDQPGHFLHDVHGRTVYDGYEDLPWGDGLMDGGLLKNGKVPDSPDGRVFWTAGGAKAFWYAFYWWDRSVDTRGACNSGIYVRGFGWPEAREAFEYGCAQFPNVVRRQRYPLVLQDVGAATSQEAGRGTDKP